MVLSINILPGTTEDSFRFASSLVRSLSSVVRGELGPLSFPPGQSPSRNILMNDIIRVVSRKVLALSRILLGANLSKAYYDLVGLTHRSIVPPRTCCKMITIA